MGKIVLGNVSLIQFYFACERHLLLKFKVKGYISDISYLYLDTLVAGVSVDGDILEDVVVTSEAAPAVAVSPA